jgi:hypothetical protein
VAAVSPALGFDDQGRAMLTYLPGEAVGDPVIRTPLPTTPWSTATG